MVIVEPSWPPGNAWPGTPVTPPLYFPPPDTIVVTEPEIKEKHIKEVKKGVLVKFEDGTWMFMATDDECYKKLKKALDEK